jgi:hypothetical protein
MTPPRAFYVYHGGQLYGQGRWSGPHATRAEAQKSCGECTRVTGAHAFIECEPLPVDPAKATRTHRNATQDRRRHRPRILLPRPDCAPLLRRLDRC